VKSNIKTKTTTEQNKKKRWENARRGKENGYIGPKVFPFQHTFPNYPTTITTYVRVY
jgi:hypothetical protein